MINLVRYFMYVYDFPGIFQGGKYLFLPGHLIYACHWREVTHKIKGRWQHIVLMRFYSLHSGRESFPIFMTWSSSKLIAPQRSLQCGNSCQGSWPLYAFCSRSTANVSNCGFSIEKDAYETNMELMTPGHGHGVASCATITITDCLVLVSNHPPKRPLKQLVWTCCDFCFVPQTCQWHIVLSSPFKAWMYDDLREGTSIRPYIVWQESVRALYSWLCCSKSTSWCWGVVVMLWDCWGLWVAIWHGQGKIDGLQMMIHKLQGCHGYPKRNMLQCVVGEPSMEELALDLGNRCCQILQSRWTLHNCSWDLSCATYKWDLGAIIRFKTSLPSLLFVPRHVSRPIKHSKP